MNQAPPKRHLTTARTVFSTLIVMAFALAAMGQDAAPPTPPKPTPSEPATQPDNANGKTAGGPRVVIPEPVKDFGEFWAGEDITHSFVIKNTGTETLKILKVKPQCGCTSTGHDQEIPPGGEGRISAKLRTSGLNHKFAKRITVTTNDPAGQNLKLALTGVAKHYVSVEPRSASFTRVRPDQVLDKTIRITNNSEQPMKLELAESESSPFSAVLTETKQGKVYELRITGNPPYQPHPNRNQAAFLLTTNIAAKPRIEIKCSASVAERLEVRPAKISIREKESTGFTQTVQFFNSGTTGVRVTEASVTDSRVTAKVIEQKPGRQYNVVLTFPANYRPPGTGARVVLQTDDRESPSLTIPIVGPRKPDEKPGQRLVGKTAPAVTLKTVGGGEVAVGKAGEDVLVLEFYVGWCGFCKRSLPDVEKLHRKYHNKGVRFIGICEDSLFTPRFSTAALPPDTLKAEADVPDSLRREFADQGIPLPESATMTKYKQYGWAVDAHKTRYLLAEEGDKLTIYMGNRKSRLPDEVRQHFEGLGLTFDRVTDDAQVVGKAYLTDSFPAMYIIGRTGVVETAHFGAKRDLVEAVSNDLDRLLTGESLTAPSTAKPKPGAE